MTAASENKRGQRRWLDPHTLSGLGSLSLIARTVVEGFLLGLHRSPRLGFSQEFAEYRAYNEGDDPRFVDWAVYGRTDRMFVRQYKGETNTRAHILIDCSASMDYASTGVSKLDVAKFIAASLVHLALRQNDAVGVLSFADDLIDVVRPSTRSGQFERLMHALDAMSVQGGTDFERSFERLAALGPKPGLVVVLSDFYLDADALLTALRPLSWQGHDIALMHLLDPAEKAPAFDKNVVVEDAETGQALEVNAEFWRTRYAAKMQNHLETTARAARRCGAEHCVVDTSEPLNQVLRQYLTLRGGRA